MGVVEVSFKHLLLEITEKLSMPAPKYGAALGPSGQLGPYVDVEVRRSDTVTEAIRSWGFPASVADPSEEEAARNSINTLRDELGFGVRDTNFEDVKFYKSLYDHLCDQYNTLMAKYNTLKWDYKFLKDCYNKTMEDRDRISAEHSEIQHHLERVFAIINRADMVVDAAIINEAAMVVDVPHEGAAAAFQGGAAAASQEASESPAAAAE